MALDLAKTEEARQLLKAGAIDPAAIVRVYVTTPRTPKDRLQILRSAFMKTLTDPDFIAETKKANLDINPLTGEEVKKIVDDLFKLKPADCIQACQYPSAEVDVNCRYPEERCMMTR